MNLSGLLHPNPPPHTPPPPPPQRFPACIMRIQAPRTTALAFSTGKMIVTGAPVWVYSVGAVPRWDMQKRFGKYARKDASFFISSKLVIISHPA